MNSYLLSRQWFDFAFRNRDKINPNHGSIYFWLIELANRLGWPETFSNPASQCMHACGINSYNTYKKAFDELAGFGFVQIVKKSTNQYTANVIALSIIATANFEKAPDRANAENEFCPINNSESTNSINKPINTTTDKPLNKDNHSEKKESEFKNLDTPGGTFPSGDLFGIPENAKGAAHTKGARARSAKPPKPEKTISKKQTFAEQFPTLESWLQVFKGTEWEKNGTNLEYYYVRNHNYCETSGKKYTNWFKQIIGWMAEAKAEGKLKLIPQQTGNRSQAATAMETANEALEILRSTRK